jgi:hypothetical protein
MESQPLSQCSGDNCIETLHEHHHGHHHHVKTDEIKPTGGLGHQISMSDPNNPQNWPLIKKIYASLGATAFGFAV